MEKGPDAQDASGPLTSARAPGGGGASGLTDRRRGGERRLDQTRQAAGEQRARRYRYRGDMIFLRIRRPLLQCTILRCSYASYAWLWLENFYQPIVIASIQGMRGHACDNLPQISSAALVMRSTKKSRSAAIRNDRRNSDG